MALKVELKPFERIIIGQSVVTNSDSRARFLIDGKAPILREKDILTAETANTPVKRLYLCIQMMYLEDDIPKYQDLYMDFVKDLLQAVPRFQAVDRDRKQADIERVALQFVEGNPEAYRAGSGVAGGMNIRPAAHAWACTADYHLAFTENASADRR